MKDQEFPVSGLERQRGHVPAGGSVLSPAKLALKSAQSVGGLRVQMTPGDVCCRWSRGNKGGPFALSSDPAGDGPEAGRNLPPGTWCPQSSWGPCRSWPKGCGQGSGLWEDSRGADAGRQCSHPTYAVLFPLKSCLGLCGQGTPGQWLMLDDLGTDTTESPKKGAR